MLYKGKIKPERSWGMDIGVDKFIEELDLNLSVTAFMSQYDDAIINWPGNRDETKTGVAGFVIKNTPANVETKGIELATSKILPQGYNVSLNYAFTDSYDGEDFDKPSKTAASPIDEQGVLVPRHQISSSLKKTIDNFEGLGDLNITLNTKWVGERRDYGNANTLAYHNYSAGWHDVILGDYITFDILSNIKINDKVYFMTLRNALTADYETSYQYGGQERMLNFGVKTEF